MFGFVLTTRQKDCRFLQAIASICMRDADILQSTGVPRPPVCKGLSGHPFPRSRGECLRGFRIKWAHLHGLVLKRQLEPGRRPGADHRGSRGTHCPPRGRHGGSIVRGAGLSFLPSVSPGPPPHPRRRLFSLAARIPLLPHFPCRGAGRARPAICTQRLTAAPEGQCLNDFCLNSRPPRPPEQHRDICSP